MVIEWFTSNNHQSCHCKISRAVLKWSGVTDWCFHVFYTKDSVCPSLVLTCLLHNERMRALIIGDCRCFSWTLHLTIFYKIGVHVNMKSKLIQFTSISISWCHLGQKIANIIQLQRKEKQSKQKKSKEKQN